MASLNGLLLRFPAGGGARFAAAGARSLHAAGAAFEFEPLFDTAPPAPGGPGLTDAGTAGHEWYRARPQRTPDGATEWDLAHEAFRRFNSGARLSGTGADPDLIEPDLIQQWPHETPRPDALAANDAACVFEGQNRDWPNRPGEFAWHLGDGFSQLRAARARAAAGEQPRIVHLDTGYDPDHATFPRGLVDLNLQRNFVEGGDDARDRGNDGILRNPGHGTGTLSILAGSHFTFDGNGYRFDEVLGGAPTARVVPVRVGNSVVQLTTGSVAKGIAYAAELTAGGDRVDVISMSMGGLASGAWADAVNKVYEAGIVFVAAAGNNFGGLPTRFIVYPARFRRVIAACGVMADRRPYWALGLRTMQGNWGPAAKMATAMAAFTPNMPWARWGCDSIVRMNGEGTSSATPQVAAAAALYMQARAAELFNPNQYPRPWMRVEVVRRALFGSADKSADGGKTDKLGNGVLRASDALSIEPADANQLKMTGRASASFSFLKVLTGAGLTESPADQMLQIEATQLAQRGLRAGGANPFESVVADPDADRVSPREVAGFLEIVADHPGASGPLRERAKSVLRAMGGGGRSSSGPDGPHRRPGGDSAGGNSPDAAPAPAPPGAPQAAAPAPEAPRAPFKPPRPPFRTLRGYAFDPTLQTSLHTVGISEVAFNVPWEKLDPGPVGQYVEVIDVDPATQCCYEPVSLDDPELLAQDGLAPSEGTPQFHQQMVYAVASLTIDNFEHALGRRVLWRPGPSLDPDNDYDDSHYVPRLRIYPHALREPNAYYSPDKIALLFGYFNAGDNDPGNHLPGGRVFTCLSHDIIAHETTHALLDGMHRRFLLPTNPDVRAFHEAFADCVALFQHFTFPEILRHQITTTRGDIRRSENLLGQLATQFGHATGARQALRDAIGKRGEDGKWRPHKVTPSEYHEKARPHDRGAVLVAAVFDAFLAIYERRTADLLRLATGGSGVLKRGAIHPDLVNRLADEAARTARHVLTMCIRGLDYCPPTDVTFGEFLRAVITADYDLVPDDDLNYRVSFIEAFRRRGIYPRDVRTLSTESLLWQDPAHGDERPSEALEDQLERLRGYATGHTYAKSRQEVFGLQWEMRWRLHEWLKNHLTTGEQGKSDARVLGLDPGLNFEVHTARFANRASPDGGVTPQLLLGILQATTHPIDPGDPEGPKMRFEGGSTIVADLRERRICYVIRKRLDSPTRIARQQDFAMRESDDPKNTYLGARSLLGGGGTRPTGLEPFALIHRGM